MVIGKKVFARNHTYVICMYNNIHRLIENTKKYNFRVLAKHVKARLSTYLYGTMYCLKRRILKNAFITSYNIRET